MDNEEYIKKVERLREIESQVKNPEFSLDKVDALIEETKKIVADCYAYTRSLRDKVDSINNTKNLEFRE